MDGKPRVQRAQATQRQKAVERRTCEAQAIGPPRQLLGEFFGCADHGTAHHIAVAVDVLRRGVDDQISAERERLLPARRQESVVDRDQSAAAFPASRPTQYP